MKVSRRFVILGVIIVACVIGLIFAGHWFGWETGFGPETTEPKQHAKTLWDWMQLLVIPVVLAGGGYFFNLTLSRNEQKSAQMRDQTERELALDNQRESALQAYIDKMSELLLTHHLRDSTDEEDEVREIARIRTLTLLRRLDMDRKKSVLQFLTEANLLMKEKPIVGLRYADFIGANLSGIYTGGENLRFADFRKANLSEGTFWRVDFSGADLREATLFEVDLSGANLSEANLTGANLSRAKITEEQLKKAQSLQGATMPDGSIHP